MNKRFILETYLTLQIVNYCKYKHFNTNQFLSYLVCSTVFSILKECFKTDIKHNKKIFIFRMTDSINYLRLSFFFSLFIT